MTNTRIKYILFCSLILLISCKESGFNSGGGSKKEETKHPAADQSTPANRAATDPTKTPQPQPPQTQPEQQTINPPADAPEHAITRGSFTVWTEPEDPRPRQDYEIHIAVTLPSGTQNYTYGDLSGWVIGTDNYKREIGPDARPDEQRFNPLWPRDKFDFNGQTATVVMVIPGAIRLVKDRIEVTSKLLSETQEIELVF